MFQYFIWEVIHLRITKGHGFPGKSKTFLEVIFCVSTNGRTFPENPKFSRKKKIMENLTKTQEIFLQQT
jgi:hypothetical protein